jgi:hypothetical protein
MSKPVLKRELALNIRKLMLEEVNIKGIREALDIKEGSWDYWYWNNSTPDDMSKGFRDFINGVKHERIVRKAESNVEVLLSSEDERVMADMTKFSLETLGKKTYSKRTETDLTTNGKELPTPILGHVPTNNSSQENSETKQKD